MTSARRVPALGDILAEHRRSMPDREALVCGDTRLSWRELDDRVRVLAAALADAGVDPGDRVLWLAQNCHRWFETLLACARIGAVCCPANWRLSAEELAFIITDAEPRLILWQDREIGSTVTAARKLADLTGVTWVQLDGPGDGHHDDEYEAFIAGAAGSARRDWPDVDADEPVLMVYTAAFAGQPNGALLSHRAWVWQNLITAYVQGTTADETFLCSGPLFHVGTIRHALSGFQLGGRNVVVRRVEAEELCRLIEAEGCTGAFLEKPTIEQMVTVNADRRYDLSTLRAAPGSEAWNAMITPERRPLRNGFGQTELAGVVTFADTRQPELGGAGRASPIAQVEVVDPDGQPVPAGGVGELVVRGPMVMNGYHRRPELNAERRRGGWHHTSDLGRREADGSLSFVGPATRIVKSASENIYPAEVEGCVRSHPAVREAAIIGVPDPVWTQSVVAVVVAEGSITADEVIEHCRTRIASYKKPKRVEFVDALPRTASGAVDYEALDDRFGGGGYPSK